MNTLIKTLDRHLIDEWRSAWKKFSVLVFAFLVVAPDAWAAINAAGILSLDEVPAKFKWFIRAVAALGIYLRLVRQNIQGGTTTVDTAVADAAPQDSVDQK